MRDPDPAKTLQDVGLQVTAQRLAVLRACMEVDDARGYEIDEAEVVYWGTCPRCQTAGRAKQGKRNKTSNGQSN